MKENCSSPVFYPNETADLGRVQTTVDCVNQQRDNGSLREVIWGPSLHPCCGSPEDGVQLLGLPRMGSADIWTLGIWRIWSRDSGTVCSKSQGRLSEYLRTGLQVSHQR